MDISIQGRNVDITARLEAYVERKVQRLDRYLPDIQIVRVDLASDGGGRGVERQKAQITVQHARGRVLRAEETSDDLMGSIDRVVDRIYRQIEKYKGKRQRRGEANGSFEGFETAVQLENEEFDFGAIVRRKHFAAAAMTEEEAIDQIELLGHDFFVFINGSTGQFNVLYRRKEGGYGLLEPEVG